eukprot:5203230-Alexandrium_andersonii.AAC.1
MAAHMLHAVVYFRLRACNAARRMPGRTWHIPALAPLSRAKAGARACVRALPPWLKAGVGFNQW